MTLHRQDHKLATLETLTGQTGTIDDLENIFLNVQVVAPKGVHVHDLWLQFFLENGATTPQQNDAAFEYLGAQGHTGALSDRWHDFWEAGGPVAEFNVLDSDGNAFKPGLSILDSDGNAFVVTNTVLDSDGNPFVAI